MTSTATAAATKYSVRETLRSLQSDSSFMEGGGGGYNRPDSPTFSTTEYLNAFTDIDRSIRNLIDGNQSPHESIITLKHQPTTKLLSSPLLTTASESVRLSQQQTPLFNIPDLLAIEEGGVDADDEDATVAFLCSSLPHYEGDAPINYNSLDDSLLAYCNQQQQITCMDEENLGDLLDNEEYIDETSWEPANSNREQESKGGLLSPQTLNDQASYNDEGLTNYEGWIDFEELLDIVRQVLKLHDFMECKVGKRRETEYMLLYAVDITTTDDGHNGDGDGWFVQIPKPNIDVKIFESEILSMAYIRENTDLPISTVWTYDFTTSNPVGVPYAILNELPGEPLELYWNQQLSSREKRRVLEQIADVVVQLSQLEFPLIGSLVMDDDNNCPTIGPLLDPRQYEIGYEDLDPFVYDDTASDGMPKHRYGPFEDTSSYYHAMIDASIDALNSYMQRNSGEEDHSLDMIELETYKDFVDNLTLKKYRKGPFVLALPNMDKHHFLIDPSTCRLTGIRDWTFTSIKPLVTLMQAPNFTFDDTPRWEPVYLKDRMAFRRNLVRYRQWFKSGLQKRSWATLSKQKSDEFTQLVNEGYWRFKFEYEIAEHFLYNNPWSFRAIWESLNPDKEFAIWFATLRS